MNNIRTPRNTDRGKLDAIFKKLRNLEKDKCCVSPGDSAILEVLAEVNTNLEAICEKIENQTLENENNLKCSQAKACDADCNVIICHTCYDVEGAIVSTNHTNPDNTPYTGGINSLDIGCVSCEEPMLQCDYEQVKVCFDDCTEGFSLIKITNPDNTITPLGLYNLDGTPSEKTVVPCQPLQVISQNQCLTS